MFSARRVVGLHPGTMCLGQALGPLCVSAHTTIIETDRKLGVILPFVFVKSVTQEVFTKKFLGMYVCVSVTLAQKIAKHAVSFQIKYIIHKKIKQPLGHNIIRFLCWADATQNGQGRKTHLHSFQSSSGNAPLLLVP